MKTNKKETHTSDLKISRNFKKRNFIEQTKAEFQRYSETPISDDEAVEIQKNLFGFIGLLIEWNNEEKILQD
jgi:hypothetical protein